MKRLVSVVLAAAVFACEDAPNAKPREITAPAPPVSSPVVALNAATARLRSSVCSSYLRERTRLQVKLSNAPTDSVLLKRATALASIITDACN